jgi:poly(3-hydroxyalkanoate) depolymerase
MPINFRRKRPPQTMRSMVVDGQQLRVAVRPGVGERPPLLLVNGIGASLELLQPFVDELDPALEVIRFDVPGVGGSPLPSWPYRFSGLCRLMAHLLSALGHDQADVLGISWGGGVAQHFAMFQRQRCRRLVLVSTAPGMLMMPAGPAVLARMATPRRYLDPAYLGEFAADLYGGSARSDPDRVSELMHGQNRVGPRRGYLYQLAAGAGWTSLPFLPLIRQPTLILSGDDDPLIPLVNARVMHKLIRRSQLHVYHDGHLGLVTEATELAPVVDRFLATDIPGPPGGGGGNGRAARSGGPGQPSRT